EARVVLETHDYLSRAAISRARQARDWKAFPNFGTLRRYVALEHRLWEAADVCTTLSLDEEKRLRRYSSHCLHVLPKAYAKPWNDPGANANWDLLLVGDEHFFNINSFEWFLEQVVERNEPLRRVRIAVVGHIKHQLEL